MSHSPATEPSKALLRKAAFERRARLPMPALSERIRQRLLDWPSFRQAGTIILYCSIRNEVDLLPLTHAFSGPSWYLPKVESVSVIRFYRYTPGDPLLPGAYGIPEPEASEPLSLNQTKTPLLILVPGLLFDRRGNRLGYGKGYYDRFLRSLLDDGVAYTAISASPDALLVDLLPAEPHDVAVDVIVTESTLLFTKPH
ncbi:MAG TPA: 5-formyltetrahydrofolate cyclo-ligase [Oculatellaceae cyanobacterium]